MRKVPVDPDKFGVSSAGRVRESLKREENETRAAPRWERVRVQNVYGAIDAVGPKEIAYKFEM